MKTYTSNQVYANVEITEWVPADVARELFEALANVKNCQESDLTEYCKSVDDTACKALANIESVEPFIGAHDAFIVNRGKS